MNPLICLKPLITYFGNRGARHLILGEQGNKKKIIWRGGGQDLFQVNKGTIQMFMGYRGTSTHREGLG